MKDCLHQILEASFRSYGERVAISQAGDSLTYAELDRLANRFAHRLQALSAAQPGRQHFVGVSSAVTSRSIAAILGVLRAGLAYVPLDVMSPPSRLRAIIDDCAIEVAIMDPLAFEGGDAIFDSLALPRLVSLADAAPPGVVSFADLAMDNDAPVDGRPPLVDAMAYVLYTSGSTGTPKGVMLTHRNAVTFVRWIASEFAMGPDDVVASRAPLNFDLSVFDIFATLHAGARLVVQDRRLGAAREDDAHVRHRAYVDLLRDERATMLYTTPSTFVVLQEKGGLDASVPLRQIMYAGEPFPPALLRRVMQALPATRVANIYGPTETNIVTCYHVPEPPDGDAPIPIGVEVDDTEIVVVDETGRPCAAGETGELWVRGGTVCLGYLGKPELTVRSLVQSPIHPYPAPMWRTGDYGRRREDGVLEYKGRIDNLVKTRGYRVETGDVEAAFVELDGVAQAVVVPVPHEKYGNALHAYVTCQPGMRPSETALLSELRQLLPSYMVPAGISILDEFPYTSTGKPDRVRLRQALLPAQAESATATARGIR